MTSQYDIERGISNLHRMNFDINKLKENTDPTKREEKVIKDKQKAFGALNIKLIDWCKEFDGKIKPLPALGICPNPDKIFVIRIPNNIKNKETKEHIEKYNGFIKSENYTVQGMDLQKGYITNVYSFFCKKRVEN